MPAPSSRLGAAAALAIALLSPASTAEACLWDQETFAAEGKELPCVVDALAGAFIAHTPEYYEARIAAADEGLALAPNWLGGLDMKAVALIRLGRLEDARAVLERRAAIDPEGYATHANLGTLYTFTGEYERALQAIDAALAIEPEAHFGREQVHRQLVVFLRDLAAGQEIPSKRDFLGLELTPGQRYDGSKAQYEAAGLDDSTIDALVAMISVYGGEGIPHIYYALADALALRGERRLAYSAYGRAAALGHPAKGKIGGWQKELDERIVKERYKRGRPSDECYLDLAKYDRSLRRRAKKYRKAYAQWEREAVRGGLEVWTRAGVEAIYEGRSTFEVDISGGYPNFYPRCPAPGVVREAGREPDENRDDFCYHAH